MRIRNNDNSNTYYVKFRVTSPIPTDSGVVSAYLIIDDSINQYSIDLKDEDLQPDGWIELGGSGELRVDLYIELNNVDGDIGVAVDLIYSMTNSETPPELP